jgi:CheY-like chemotaxis protein
VVEDEQPLREYLVTILNAHGYRTFAAASGSEALEVWAEHRGEIQLLLTDMITPGGLTGCQMAERLLRVSRAWLSLLARRDGMGWL